LEGDSLVMFASGLKAANENVLDAMDLGGHVARREASHFCNFVCVHTLQKQKNQLPVKRLELASQRYQPLQRHASISASRDVNPVVRQIDFIDADQFSRLRPAISTNVG
jgi:hypothetical protein